MTTEALAARLGRRRSDDRGRARGAARGDGDARALRAPSIQLSRRMSCRRTTDISGTSSRCRARALGSRRRLRDDSSRAPVDDPGARRGRRARARGIGPPNRRPAGPDLAPAVGGTCVAFAAWIGCIVVALVESRGRQLARPAVLAVLALVMTGSALALAHLQGPTDLLETAYGATLGVKVALVAVTLALGAAARRRTELAVALVVLAAASLLVSIAPPVLTYGLRAVGGGAASPTVCERASESTRRSRPRRRRPSQARTRGRNGIARRDRSTT